MAVEMYRISREYVWWMIETPNDISNSTVEVACLPNPDDQPVEADWVAGSIIAPDDPVDGDGFNWWARALVGDDGADVDLSGETTYPVDFQSWVRITDTPERPVRKPGVITIL